MTLTDQNNQNNQNNQIKQNNNFYSKRIQCDTRFLNIRKILQALCPYSEIRNNELIEPITFELLLDNPFILNGRCYHISTIKNIIVNGNKKDPFTRDDIPDNIISLFLPAIIRRKYLSSYMRNLRDIENRIFWGGRIDFAEYAIYVDMLHTHIRLINSDNSDDDDDDEVPELVSADSNDSNDSDDDDEIPELVSIDSDDSYDHFDHGLSELVTDNDEEIRRIRQVLNFTSLFRNTEIINVIEDAVELYNQRGYRGQRRIIPGDRLSQRYSQMGTVGIPDNYLTNQYTQ